jgi:hypothetical protein
MAARRRVWPVLTPVAWISAAVIASAQPTTARITGTVRDDSGRGVPDTAVTVVETESGASWTQVTGADGTFALVGLRSGTYDVVAERSAFRPARLAGWKLPAGGRLAIDLVLEPDRALERPTQAPTVVTDSSPFMRTVTREQVDGLAFNGRDSLQLTAFAPGAVAPTIDALERLTDLAIDTSIGGSRTNAHLSSLDGGSNLDPGSHDSFISSIGLEFVDHVRIEASSASAEYGRQSGAAVVMVTRAGTNHVNGSAFEYLRRSGLDARNYFVNLRGVETRALSFDNAGATVGGPLVRSRAFFLGGVDWKRIRRSSTPAVRTLPTSAMRRGDFGALPIRLTNPSTGRPFPGNVIPPGLITPDGRAIANVYAAMAGVADSYDDDRSSDNAMFQSSSAFDFHEELVRLDIRAGASNRFTARALFQHDSLLAPYGTLINSQLPTVPTRRNRPARSIQVLHATGAGSHLANEAALDVAWHEQTVRPLGQGWLRQTYGFAFPQIYAGGRYEGSIPDVTVGGIAGFRGASGALTSPASDASLSDTLTWHSGVHTLAVGGLIVSNRETRNGGTDYAGAVAFSTSGTMTTGSAFADALLGNFRRYSEAQLDPVGDLRSFQLEAFATDAWRVNGRLTVEAGVRYARHVPTTTRGNNSASFDPSRYDPADAVAIETNGTLVPGAGNRFNGLTRPGGLLDGRAAGIPGEMIPVVVRVPVTSSRGFYRSQHLFAPRVAIAWTPGGRGTTVVRGTVGLSFDRPELNLHASLSGNPPFVMSADYENGSLSNPASASPAALAPWGTIESIDPGLAVPRIWRWSGGVQRRLPWWGLTGEASYSGSRGARLIRRPDVNAPSFRDLVANIPLKYSTNYWRPYKGFSAIDMYVSDGRSDYQAMGLSLSRRRGTVHVAVDYTLSRSNDTASSNSDGVDPGISDVRYYYGRSAHDRRHILAANWSWRLPDPTHGGSAWRAAAGGWDVSGAFRYQSGAPFTVTASTAIGARRADYLGGTPYRYSVDAATGVVTWLDPSRFAVPPDTRLGNSGRNQFVGPSYRGWDLLIRKTIGLGGRTQLQVRAEIFNALNQVNWNNPASSLTGATPFGTITSAGPPREVQLGIRLAF